MLSAMRFFLKLFTVSKNEALRDCDILEAGEVQGMSFVEIMVGVGVVSFIIYASFNIFYLIEMRRTSLAVRQFVARAEQDIYPTLAAAKQIFENIQTVTDNTATLSKSLGGAAEVLTSAQDTIKDIYQSYDENLGQSVRANVFGLKAGIKTGVSTLLSNLKDRKEGLS
jgi:hypothetical protein